MSIVEFLEARIAEDESLAQAAIKSHAPDEVWESELGSLNLWPEDIAFWASQTPYRVLAECAAKRAIIKQHEQSGSRWEGFPRADKQVTYCLEDQHASPCMTLSHLAAVYADHPDYQQEWDRG